MESLALLWRAESIAIIGATQRLGAVGRAPVENLLRYGYAGKIFPINPKSESILGVQAFSNIKDVGVRIDLALIMLPAESVLDAVIDCGKAGVKVAIVMSSGFAEADAAGAIAQKLLIDAAKQYGLRLVGPNCIGAVGGGTFQVASFSPVFSAASTHVGAGNLGLVSQSGALGFGMYSLGLERELPIGIVVTTGNEGDVTNLEVALAMAEESEIDGILLYVESLQNAPLLREVAARKPVAVLKVGRSEAGAIAAASHTGALATEDRVVEATIRSTGAVRVGDIEELLDAGAIFAAKFTVYGDRIAIITTSGGSGIMATDALERFGLRLAELKPGTIAALSTIIPSYGNATNPVDVTAAVMTAPDLFERCLDVLVKDPGVDAIIACFAVLTGGDVDRIAKALGKVQIIRNLPIVVSRTGSQSLAPQATQLFAEAKLPIFPTPDRAVRALAILKESVRPVRAILEEPFTMVIEQPTEFASEKELKEIWHKVGVPVPSSLLISHADAAVGAVVSVGGSAVMKAVVPGLLHKSEAGGVVLDVNEDNAVAVFHQLSHIASPVEINAVLVETFIPKGVEALVGITSSAFGKVLTIGVGGILTEIISDVAIRLLPVDRQEVREMIAETKLEQLFKGARGAPSVDVESFIDSVVKISTVVHSWELDCEIDINPLTVLPSGAWVLDSAYSLTTNQQERTHK